MVRLEGHTQKGTARKWSWLWYYSMLPYCGLEATLHCLRNIADNVKENETRGMPESRLVR